MLVPVGCWEAYAYDDTYWWYQFVNIKENAMATRELATSQAYTLKNAADHSYLVYDEVNDGVMHIALDANINDENPNHSWQVIQKGGKTYLYSIGARKYLSHNMGNEWSLTEQPSPVMLTDGDRGVTIANAGDWLFVLNDRMSVDESAAGLDAIPCDDDDSSVLYDLQGRPVHHPQAGQLYIERSH